MIVHVMNNKTGIYIVCGGVVCFTSTVALGKTSESTLFKHELSRVYSYWGEHGAGKIIKNIIISGQDASKIGNDSNISPDPKVPVEVARIWQNAFSSDDHIPQITFDDSLQYVIAAGLALP